MREPLAAVFHTDDRCLSYLFRWELCLPDCSRASFCVCCVGLVIQVAMFGWAGLSGNCTELGAVEDGKAL
jgi:hypothetical protein